LGTNYLVTSHHMPEEQRHQHSYMLRSAKIIYQLNRKLYFNQQTKKLFKKMTPVVAL